MPRLHLLPSLHEQSSRATGPGIPMRPGLLFCRLLQIFTSGQIKARIRTQFHLLSHAIVTNSRRVLAKRQTETFTSRVCARKEARIGGSCGTILTHHSTDGSFSATRAAQHTCFSNSYKTVQQSFLHLHPHLHLHLHPSRPSKLLFLPTVSPFGAGRISPDPSFSHSPYENQASS